MIADFFELMTQWMQTLVLTLGAPGIAFVALFENLFPPTPSEFLYPLAGAMAYRGDISPLAIIVAGVTGSLTGSIIYYGLGYHLGAERARAWVERYGRLRVAGRSIVIATAESYDRAQALFVEHGTRIVLVARLLPVVHSVISIPAGAVRLPFPRFILFTTLGSLGWIAPLTLLGYFMGSQCGQVLEWMRLYEELWYAALAAVMVLWIGRRQWRANRQRLEEEATRSVESSAGVES